MKSKYYIDKNGSCARIALTLIILAIPFLVVGRFSVLTQGTMSIPLITELFLPIIGCILFALILILLGKLFFAISAVPVALCLLPLTLIAFKLSTLSAFGEVIIVIAAIVVYTCTVFGAINTKVYAILLLIAELFYRSYFYIYRNIISDASMGVQESFYHVAVFFMIGAFLLAVFGLNKKYDITSSGKQVAPPMPGAHTLGGKNGPSYSTPIESNPIDQPVEPPAKKEEQREPMIQPTEPVIQQTEPTAQVAAEEIPVDTTMQIVAEEIPADTSAQVNTEVVSPETMVQDESAYDVTASTETEQLQDENAENTDKNTLERALSPFETYSEKKPGETKKSLKEYMMSPFESLFGRKKQADENTSGEEKNSEDNTAPANTEKPVSDEVTETLLETAELSAEDNKSDLYSETAGLEAKVSGPESFNIESDTSASESTDEIIGTTDATADAALENATELILSDNSEADPVLETVLETAAATAGIDTAVSEVKQPKKTEKKKTAAKPKLKKKKTTSKKTEE